MKKLFARVYLPLLLDKPYTYEIPKSTDINIGDIVLVPFRGKGVYGIVYDFVDTLDFDDSKLKAITHIPKDMPPLGENLLLFLKKLSNYYIANFGNVLKLAINIAGFDFKDMDTLLSLNTSELNKIKITPQRKKILDCFDSASSIEKKHLAEVSQVSISVINKLIKDNVLQVEKNVSYSNFQKDIIYNPVDLSQEQKDVSVSIINHYNCNDNKFSVALLQGVPGAGKTEVYFEAVNNALKQNKQVLIMLPEIALSTQIVQRFEDRFGVKPYVWHSSISNKLKKDTWVCSSNNNLKVIIGTRSSLFLPFNNLGLIIVDEEHDSSYKQEEGVIYNARDMAVMRAKLHNIPILLASATPSLETLYNVKINKYKIWYLNNRFNIYQMPKVQLVDMRYEVLEKNSYLSKDFIGKISTNLQKGTQSLLFVNKRGYANVSMCKSCGEKIVCKNCSIAMVEHKSKNILLCHYCGYSCEKTNVCTYCLGESVASFGFGVEKLYEEIKIKFPNARCIILSSDTIKNHKNAADVVEEINNNKYDILIGTQIISKGYHFPNLTFVGIVDGDYTYSLDLKSSERNWQMLYQVAGRSGRGNIKGEVMMQTYNPNDTLIQSLVSQDYDLFINKELQSREKLNFPPFGKLAGIILSCSNEVKLNNICNELKSCKPQGDGYEILGSTDAPIYYLRGMYRKRFLVRSNMDINIQKLIAYWLNKLEIPSFIKLQIDIDPISFY